MKLALVLLLLIPACCCFSDLCSNIQPYYRAGLMGSYSDFRNAVQSFRVNLDMLLSSMKLKTCTENLTIEERLSYFDMATKKCPLRNAEDFVYWMNVKDSAYKTKGGWVL